jgi:neutral amino acid transport system substrate-binding protein
MKNSSKKFNGKFNQGDRSAAASNSTMMMALMSLSAAVLLTSCQGGGNSPQVSDQNQPQEENGLKLGSLAPATGDLASIGQNWPPAVQISSGYDQ